tara:strand:- start:2840 stop:3043 length:204 start_codon:yes stop_codon:yes gene_type:complete
MDSSTTGMEQKKMEKSDLRANKDSQGLYSVYEFGVLVWDGFAASASEAKDLAIEWEDNKPSLFDDEW